MTDDHKFEKDLAIIQVKATIATCLGSILISVGLALVVFGYSIPQNPLGLNPDRDIGAIMIASGIVLLIGSLYKKIGEIRKL